MLVGPHDAGEDLGAPDVTDAPPARCTSNDDCARSPEDQRVCDVSTGRCVGCVASNDTCPADRHCDSASSTCVAGCRNDDGCRGAADGGVVDGGVTLSRCDTAAHSCVQCTQNAHCPPGNVCMGNACVRGCTDTQPCATGETCCGGGCVDTRTSTMHCGTCGTTCNPANATPVCAAGACVTTSCNAGFGDCDMNASNGCETDTRVLPAHCGGCGMACAARAHTTVACAMGTCAYACEAGFGDCDGDASNGCETDTSASTTHCGMCGNACSYANAMGVCVSGRCALGGCETGFSNCDMSDSNGCETNTNSSLTACGACGAACAPANASGACTLGVCSVASCNGGFADCDMMVANGCEVNTQTSATNCGRCGAACALPNAAPVCAAGACVTTSCNAGFGDCDGMAANGCETDTRVTLAHCGGCGMACATRANTTATCAAGACSYTCNAGFADCDGSAANGCEVNLSNTASNCGRCGNVCASGVACVVGACLRFPSTGAEGAFNPTANTVLPPGVHNYTTINIPAGVRVTTTGSGVLDLRATGTITIAGSIDVSGSNGGSQTTAVVAGNTCIDNGSGSGGGATGDPLYAAPTGNTRTSGTAGPGGPGGTGASGASGASRIGGVTIGVGAIAGGGGGAWSCTGGGGGGGGGYAGGGGGFGYQSGECSCTGVGGNGGDGGGAGGGIGGRSQGRGGNGGSSGTALYDGQAGFNQTVSTSGCGYNVGHGGGGGGGSIGADAAADLQMLTTFRPGSAGGGGGGDEGAGGGGAGGALRLASPVSITVAATGRLLADGGRGGYKVCGGGPGGGGSGGAIYLTAPAVNVATGAAVSVNGGGGGGPGGEGRGGIGRVRVTAVLTTCTLAGTFTPTLVSGCAATSGSGTPARVYVAAWPD